MAKINLANQHNQEGNLRAVAFLGVLMCMVVTIVGIKLWWFKHRLSFEQNNTPNSAAGVKTPTVIVPRRSKQQKYKKDKRYSQQIYESVEVHGVFRQKSEDDYEFQRSQQMPPVRVRQLSDSSSFLILPPIRTKRRDQVHSTAFEDLEIVTPPLTTASSNDLTIIPESNIKISLTFEEFERQFKLKELKSEIPEPHTLNNKVSKMPVTSSLRLNRSSSAMVKPEKTQQFLKSSQSITIPEFQKIAEKKGTSFSKPTEDLTKIDDYDEPRLLEAFGKHRPNGYMKYEEVDSDLQEEYEKQEYYNLTVGDINESPKAMAPFKGLTNNCMICYDNLETQSDVKFTEDLEQKEVDFGLHTIKAKEVYSSKLEYKSDKDQGPTELLTDIKNLESNYKLKWKLLKQERSTKFPEFSSVEEHNPKKFSTEDQTLEQGNSKEDVKQRIGITTTNKTSDIFESTSLQEDIDNAFDSWPQFDEKIETPKVNVARFYDQNSEVDANASNEKITLNKRKTIGIVSDKTESLESRDMGELQESFDNKFSQMHSLDATNLENREVTFDSLLAQNSDSRSYSKSPIKQRRPTGFVRENDYFITYNDDSDEDIKTSNPRNPTENIPSDIEIVKVHSKVNFKDNCFSNEADKYTLNQRRPTGFLKSDINSQENAIELSKIYVKFDETTDFKDQQEIRNSVIQHRRPTGFIKEFEMMNLIDDKDRNKEDEITKNVLENPQTIRSKKTDQATETLPDQIPPTDLVQKKELDQVKKQVNFQFNKKENDTPLKENLALKERRPTGFITKDEIKKKVDSHLNYNLDEADLNVFENKQLQQQTPTDFIDRKDIILDQPVSIYQPSKDNDFNNKFDSHLWQEMEKDIEQDFAKNFEEEFAKIPYSYELNENDFLELIDKSPKLIINNTQQPLGFGKTIEDDWENFEELKIQKNVKHLKSLREGKMTYSDEEYLATTSILKDNNLEENIQVKPRKSKVTFDFEMNEGDILPRKTKNFLKQDSDHEDDVYEKSPPPIPLHPELHVLSINYNTATTLTPIVPVPRSTSFLSSQISPEDNGVEDSWSAIRKHRNMTKEFQYLSAGSELSQKLPKPSYRNPMAQLAIQRAKALRADKDGSRSINNKKSKSSKRQKHNVFNLNNDNYQGTEA